MTLSLLFFGAITYRCLMDLSRSLFAPEALCLVGLAPFTHGQAV